MFLFKKVFKIILYTLILLGFFILIDFSSLSFKTIIPKDLTHIETREKVEIGLIKKSKEISLEEQTDFEGEYHDIIDFVNKAREEEGLLKLEENEQLNLSAMEKAQHMKNNDYFDHISPQGLKPWYFAQKQNYNYKSFGENLAEGYFSAESVHEGWMNSPGHRENILSKKFKEIGVAILEFQQEGQKSYLIVQHFGSQLTAQDSITKIVCEKDSKENCEDVESKENQIEKLIEKQEKIIKEAIEIGVTEKDLSRLEENLKDLKETEDELEDYLKECEDFMAKCDLFK